MFRRVTAAIVSIGAVVVMGCVPVAAFAARVQPTPTPSPSPSASPSPVPTDTTPSSPARVREEVTSAFYQSLQAKVAAGQRLGLHETDVLDYGVQNLWARGIDGAGTTVAIILSSPDPTLPTVLANYSTQEGLPQAVFSSMQFPASNPPTTSCSFEQACGPGEDQLDAESIHTMAPYAKILFVYTPVPETLGIQGWPQLGQAIAFVSSHHLANVITISEGDSEANFGSPVTDTSGDPSDPGASQAAEIHSMDPAILTAAANNIPLLFASGDCGTTQVTLLNEQTQCFPNTTPAAGHPVDSPWVTSVGGTIPNPGISTPGGRTAPDTLWTTPPNASNNQDASGAGVSTVYAKPYYQQGLPELSGVTGRSEPDITLDGRDGTSQASPTLAGILALATQFHRGDLGTINPALYRLGPEGARAGILPLQAGTSNGIDGLTGLTVGNTPFNVADGWGTIWAPNFIPALSRTVNRQPALLAREELNQLEGNAQVSTSNGTITVQGHGFVPGRMPNGSSLLIGFGFSPTLPGDPLIIPGTTPVLTGTETTPGQPWDTVTATLTTTRGTPVAGAQVTVTAPDVNGNVTATVTTSGLRPGVYRLTIQGDDLTQHATVLVRPTHGR